MMVYLIVAVASVCVGSFLNVVIHRLPKILADEWRNQCEDYLKLAPTVTSPSEYSLSWPSSHCPTCQHPLKFWHNIPLLSFCLLRGRCAFCHAPIAWRYPLVELVTVLLSLAVIAHFGLGYQAGFALIFTWYLIAITGIDWEHQLIPDRLSLTLLWMGLLINTTSLFASPIDAVIGAASGYLSLWTFTFLFKVFTGKQGMGHGDFKLFAAFGAWLGWQPLLLIILIATTAGATVGITQILMKKLQRDTPIPFGPFLAIGGWFALLFAGRVLAWYLPS